MTDSVLVRVARGEADSLRECIDEYGGLVWSLARRLSRTRVDAEDATQDIFLQLWSQANRFDSSQGSEKTFIAMIARRRLIDRLRKARTDPLADFEPGTFETFLRLESVDTLSTCVEIEEAGQALRKLPPMHRQVIELGCVFGLTQAQIARHLDLPLGTVKTSMRRGLMTLRERLNGEDAPVSRPRMRDKPRKNPPLRQVCGALGRLPVKQRHSNAAVGRRLFAARSRDRAR